MTLEGESANVRTALTDQQGSYRFAKLPPGQYLLGVSLTGLNSKSPFAPHYYPGVSNKNEAIPIHITGPQQITDRDFTVEDARKTREILVAVKWADGRPVTNASLRCRSNQSADSISRYTNAQGEAIFKVLADRDYEVQADRLNWSACSRPVRPLAERPKVRVTAAEWPIQVDLVIDPSNDISAREQPSDMSRFNDQAIGH